MPEAYAVGGWLIKLPRDWRTVKRNGSAVSDILPPVVFVLLGTITVGLVLFALGIAVGLIPYK
ncbi:MAG: hypothetical protein HY685_05230 [Chloroflexi bacterium]|nr:hypothetical protein [Chloroflexota bacterium]